MTWPERTRYATTSSGLTTLDKVESLMERSGFPFDPDVPQDNQDSQDPYDLNRQTKNNNGSSQAFSRKLLDLPLKDYLRIVLEFCAQLREERSYDSWRSPLWDFARFCRAHPTVADLPDDEAVLVVEAELHTHTDLPAGVNPWEHFFPEGEDGESLSGELARLDFMTSWGSVRHVPFRDALHNALRLSEKRPLLPGHNRGKLYERFVSLAVWLQRLRPEATIYLPTRTVGELLGCDQRTVSRLRKLAIQDELLEIVKTHRFYSTSKGEATEFRVAIERFNGQGEER